MIGLIACTNVANILTARTADRMPELFIPVGGDRHLRHRFLRRCPEDAGNGDTLGSGHNSGPAPGHAIAAGDC